MRFLVAFLLLLAVAPAWAQTVPVNDRKPAPKPEPRIVVERDHRGMCDGAGRALACGVGGAATVYVLARAAGWQGFGFEWEGGRKRADLAPTSDGRGVALVFEARQ